MGGDLGPRAVFCACEIALAQFPQLSLRVFGTQAAQQHLGALPLNPRFSWQLCPSEFSADSKPTEVLRQKDSSMWCAVAALAAGQVDACVSAGNTGALMVCGKRLLGMVQGVERPAICQRWPTRRGQTLVLDLGANVEVTPAMICQFARMGSLLSGLPQARVALLNIGTEEFKGGDRIANLAAALRQDHTLNFVGFIEANHLLDGDVDVVVTDGFTGNVALKASEGAAVFLVQQLRAAFSATWYGRLIGQLAKPVLLKWRTRFDPGRYNGASFLGLGRPLIKSHGSADAEAFANALAVALAQAEQQLPAQLRRLMADGEPD